MAVQNHIHLDLVANIGGSPEYAPAAKWTVNMDGWEEEIEVNASFNRSWNGTPYFATITDDSGDPKTFTNYRYNLRVTASEYTSLKALLLKHVALVDNIHPADGATHAAYVQHMRFIEMGAPRPYNVGLEKFAVTIYLVEEALADAI